MIRTCERCGAHTRRPRYCSEQCSATARQRRLRAKDRAAAPIIAIATRLTIAVDDWQPSPDVEAAFNDEIRWKRAMIKATRRNRRPIPRIDRPDIAALDDSEEQGVA